MKSLLCSQNVSFYYGYNPVFMDINFNFYPGEIICFLGNNGSGKSTLLKICAGLFSPASGNIFLNSQNINALNSPQRAQEISWLGQDLLPAEEISVAQFLQLNTNVTEEILRNPSQDKDCSGILRFFDVLHLLENTTFSLSGGEWKRVQLARLWLRSARLLVLDEPEGSLDLRHKTSLVSACRSYALRHRATLLISTHDLRFARLVATRICALAEGHLVWNSTAEMFWHSRVIEKVFGFTPFEPAPFF